MDISLDSIITFFKNNAADFAARIFASLVFLYILSRLKPNIKICDKIAIEPQKDGSINYGFKVINKSPFFKVYDMKAKLFSLELEPSENNIDYKLEQIELRKSNIWFMNKFNPRHYFQDQIFGEKKLKKRTDYATQFFTETDVKKMVFSKKIIRFELLARHSLSGFTVVKHKEFNHKNDFIDGSFFSGNTSKIKA